MGYWNWAFQILGISQDSMILWRKKVNIDSFFRPTLRIKWFGKIT
jgi:hypothetical protein